MGETDTGADSVETQGTETAEGAAPADTSEVTTEEKPGESSSKTAEGGEDHDDEEAPTRKGRTNAEWVALRQQRKQERDQRRAEDHKGDDGEDEDISPEDAKLIDRRIAKALEPIAQRNAQEQITRDIQSFVAENPDFKPYAEKVAKWAGHDSWKDIPIDRIFFAAAGPKLIKLGADRKAAQDKKAAETRPGGSSTAAATGSKSIGEMTDKEFEEYTERVKMGRK